MGNSQGPDQQVRTASRHRGHLWSGLFGREVSREEVCLALVLLKVSRAYPDVRAGRRVKRDTLVDIAGYAALVEQLELEDEGRKSPGAEQ